MEVPVGFPSAYDLYVSSGSDTGKTFTDHLYTALCNAGFRTFGAIDAIQIGHRIKPQRERAIEQSTISIIVFTKHCGYSKRRLNELLKILERKKFDDHYIVFPIFYHVRPRTVGKQKGSFREAFIGYEKSGEHSKEKIARWRKALKEVSKIAGRVFPDESNGCESLFIQKVVELVRTVLEGKVLDVASYKVGIESRVKAIDLWLKDPADVSVGVISGSRGIGKTTIARVAYDWNITGFDACSLLDIKKAFEKEDGLIGLQSQFLSDISMKEKQKIDDIKEGFVKIRDAICGKRILLFLDGVDQIEQVNALLSAGNSFHKGSKIIITTSHEQLLGHLTHKPFKVKQLDDHESLRLFCWHAFSKFHPDEGYLELSERVVRCCEGLPLSLQFFGSSLSGKNSELWGSALQQLEASPDERNCKTLEVGYKLLDDPDQRLFLAIASFFVGKDKDEAVKVLEKRDFYSKNGMQNLMDRSLIGVDENNKLIMQRLVLDMARAIIGKGTVDDPGKHKAAAGAGAKCAMDTGEGSLRCKNGKRKRPKDYEEESVPQDFASSSFKRLCLGIFSLFKLTLLTKLVREQD